MKVKLRGGETAPEQEILALEDALGCPISSSFRAFIRTYDGASPDTNIFRISESNSGGVSEFIPVREILKNRMYIEDIPRQAYPVAHAECGNFVLIDEGRNGAVFFWDHELPDEPTDLAANFGAFLDLLEPVDMTTIELKPGKVKKVWVDPEFLRRLKAAELD